MYFRLHLVLSAVLIKGDFSADVQSKQVHAFAGGAIILPCSIEPAASSDIQTVEWSKEVEGQMPAIVFLYRDGCETFEMKDSDFEYRTSLIMRQLQKGNFSLRIANVKLSDTGTFHCLLIWKNKTKEESIVELVVASSSDPKLSVVSVDSRGVTVQCEALCWMPVPVMTTVDDEGNKLTEEEQKQELDPRGCYNIKQNVTLQNPLSKVVCKVHQQQRNHSKMTEILLPDFGESCVMSYLISAAVTTLLFITAFCIYIWVNKKHYSSDGGNQEQMTDISDQTSKSQSNETQSLLDQQIAADNKQNSLTEELNQQVNGL
ncbi:PREDICTED: putative selection and upkeep of intraepithelial T-cells protein 1 homolog [Cyprinodon variegatus]|uniref:Putative selection and upkeep of intraepithelial T-cells protein 1 homolog n=1 Tax=Cyprinodon variegatus TaxID=28743 RepID=A0A3Q2ECB9_CYPVA|nr:PREDICTED: putative selection and upkeep of intraepithelial T-cells protein 1 homolog [Cyprinodon variegatus]